MSIKLSIVDFETFHRRVTNNEVLFVKGVRVILGISVAKKMLNESPAMIVYNGIKDLFNNNIIYSDMTAKCRKTNKKNLMFLNEVMNTVRFSDVFMKSRINTRDALALFCLSIKEFNAIRFDSFTNFQETFYISTRYNSFNFVSHPNVLAFYKGNDLQTIQREYINDNVRMIPGRDDNFKTLQTFIWSYGSAQEELTEILANDHVHIN